MAKNDLLKEAIADAKAVRETAIANAKLALEEAFTPKLQSMLSNKIQEEEDEDVSLVGDEGDATVADVADDVAQEVMEEVGGVAIKKKSGGLATMFKKKNV